MSRNQAVVAHGLTRKFGSFTAVDGLELDVARGEIFGFLGANGAGKTTAIRMLCGLLAPTSGSATIDGADVVRRPNEVKARIGYMAQKFSLYDDLTVVENIRFFADVYLVPRKVLKERIERVLDDTGLRGREDVLTQTLPAGIKQRLALASALIHEPRVLFLDEPTAGVDPMSRRVFWKRIHQLRTQGTTVFVTTHHLDEAENCTRVMFMQDGQTVGLGSPRTLKRQADRGDRIRIASAHRGQLQPLVDAGRLTDLVSMGAAWHAKVAEPDRIDQLQSDLGLPIERIEPSLEDVFLEACSQGGSTL